MLRRSNRSDIDQGWEKRFRVLCLMKSVPLNAEKSIVFPENI